MFLFLKVIINPWLITGIREKDVVRLLKSTQEHIDQGEGYCNQFDQRDRSKNLHYLVSYSTNELHPLVNFTNRNTSLSAIKFPAHYPITMPDLS